ncbi:MAG: 50S ribosomal protein L28 [Clostridiales bacterium]|nr:50S ribosomal protein L28 [Clostridiales bacterium]
MAKCAICNKSVMFGHKVSHSNRKSNRMWKPNIKRVRCIVNGTHKKLYVCTSCLKSGKVQRA